MSSIYRHFTQIYTAFTQLGTTNEKETKEEVKLDISSPEPLIEEPASPGLPEQTKTVIRAIAEIIEIDDQSLESEPKIEEPPKRKPGRGKSVQFDIIEEEQKSEPVTPVSEELPKKIPQRGRSASREEADLIEIKEPDIAKTPTEADLPKAERQNTIQATIEEAEVVLSKLKAETSIEENVPKKQLQKAVFAEKALADIVEYTEDKIPEQITHKTVERQESQKGVRQIEEEEDEEVEALLKRAQKQRSLIEDLDKLSQTTQGILLQLTFIMVQKCTLSSQSFIKHLACRLIVSRHSCQSPCTIFLFLFCFCLTRCNFANKLLSAAWDYPLCLLKHKNYSFCCATSTENKQNYFMINSIYFSMPLTILTFKDEKVLYTQF